MTAEKVRKLSDPHAFDDFVCARCAHVSQRHAWHSGPCADCRAVLALHPCEQFIMLEEDRAAVEAISI